MPPLPNRPDGTDGNYNRGLEREGVPLPDGVDPWTLLNVQIADEPNPPMVSPGIEVATPGEGILIDVEVKDRLLMELKRRLFPSDVEGILYSAITGDVYWMDQLFQLMIDTWPRLQTNIGKLKRAVVSIDYTWNPYKPDDTEKPTPSAIEKSQLCKRAFNGMSSNMAFQECDFLETLGNIAEAIPSGFVVSEVYWEARGKEVVPRSTRRIPARYYRYPYVIEATDRLMLNPSGTLGGTDLYDFPPYKFIVAIKHSSVHHPCFSIMMRCLAAWWVASRFGLEWFMNYAQLFGIPYRKATYDSNDITVYNKLVQMMRQAGSASWGVFPAGTEVEILSAANSTGNLPQERLLEYADKVCDILLLGQTLTTEVGDSGSRALGGVHKEVLDEITKAAALWVAKIINTQLVPGIIRFNYGDLDPGDLELPTFDPVIKSPIDLLQTAQSFQILFGRGQGQMGIPVKKSELYERLEFSEPDPKDDVYEPPAPEPMGGGSGGNGNGNGNGNGLTDANGNPTQPPPPGLGGEPKGTQPENQPNPKGVKPPQAPPRNVRASREFRTITFTADYGLESAPGEILKYVEAKIGGDDVEILKRNVDAGDDKVCAACKDITEEGWISADDIFRGFTANAPHHPNCRCKTEYRAGQKGAWIHHDSDGNPYHHPDTGKFVKKPNPGSRHPGSGSVEADFNPDEPRDPSGKWTSGAEHGKEHGKEHGEEHKTEFLYEHEGHEVHGVKGKPGYLLKKDGKQIGDPKNEGKPFDTLDEADAHAESLAKEASKLSGPKLTTQSFSNALAGKDPYTPVSKGWQSKVSPAPVANVHGFDVHSFHYGTSGHQVGFILKKGKNHIFKGDIGEPFNGKAETEAAAKRLKESREEPEAAKTAGEVEPGTSNVLKPIPYKEHNIYKSSTGQYLVQDGNGIFHFKGVHGTDLFKSLAEAKEYIDDRTKPKPKLELDPEEFEHGPKHIGLDEKNVGDTPYPAEDPDFEKDFSGPTNVHWGHEVIPLKSGGYILKKGDVHIWKQGGEMVPFANYDEALKGAKKSQQIDENLQKMTTPPKGYIAEPPPPPEPSGKKSKSKPGSQGYSDPTDPGLLAALKAWKDKLSNHEKDAIDSWTGGGYKAIRHHQLGDSNFQMYKDKAEHFEKGMEKAPKFNGTLFRGMKYLENKDIDDFRQGTWTNKTSASASVSKIKAATCFAGLATSSSHPSGIEGHGGDNDHRLLMEIHNNHTASALNPVGSYELPGIAGEKEVVLKRGAVYNVKDFKENHYGPFAHHVVLEEVNPHAKLKKPRAKSSGVGAGA